MSVTVNFTFEKKHFLMLGLIIAIPFLILAISNIIATTPAPTGQYHSASELWVNQDIDMNGFNLTNTKKITTETITATNLCFAGVCKSSWTELAESILWGNNNLETNEINYCEELYGTPPTGGWYYYDRNETDGNCVIVNSGNPACPTDYTNKMTKTQAVTGCAARCSYNKCSPSSVTTGFHNLWGNTPLQESVTGSWAGCTPQTYYATVLEVKCVHT